MRMIAICRSSLQRVLRPIDRVSAQGASHNTRRESRRQSKASVTVASLVSRKVPLWRIPTIAALHASPRQIKVGTVGIAIIKPAEIQRRIGQVITTRNASAAASTVRKGAVRTITPPNRIIRVDIHKMMLVGPTARARPRCSIPSMAIIGWHDTGDLGRFDEDVYLHYGSRKPEKELIKSGGENVYPAEVERAILDLPEVTAVSVIGVLDQKYGKSVKSVVELEPGKELGAEAAAQAVADRIASFKKPRLVDFVEALPRTDSGEVDREQVRASYG